jgi:G8 domain/Carboxypeptidase regulatory-like domain/Fibronectin type III domain
MSEKTIFVRLISLQILLGLLFFVHFTANLVLAAPTPNTQNYVFSTATNESLTNMTGATTIIGSNLTNASSDVLPIGFDFFFMGTPVPSRFAQFSVNSKGVLRLGTTQILSTLNVPLGQSSNLPVIAPYAASLKTSATGLVVSKLNGTAPNRVLVVQWQNMSSSGTSTTADLTFEVRLFETSGIVEFVYGSMTHVGSTTFPQIGLTSANSAGSVGLITAPQSGSPAPSYDGATAPPGSNVYANGSIPVLTSTANGSRRIFRLAPPIPNAAPLNVTFSNLAATSLTVNWIDTATDENGYAIYASGDGGTTFGFLASVGQNAASANVSGLLANTNYIFRVSAVSEGSLTSAAENNQTTLPAGSFTANSTGGNWSNSSTWANNAVPTATDSVTIPSGSVVTLDAATNTAYDITVDGILEFSSAQNTVLNAHTITVSSIGTFQSAANGTQIHTLNLSGDLINNGTLDFSTNTNTSGTNIVFNGITNSTFGGTGTTTDVRQITLNTIGFGGFGQTVELNPANFTVRGSTAESANGFLVLTNGILKVSGTFTGAQRTFTTGSILIPRNTGIWINNPNFAVVYNITGINNGGLVRVSNGTMTLGNSVTTASLLGGSVIVESGLLETTGSVSPLNFTQTGGTVIVGKLFCGTSFSATGSYSTSNGTIILQGQTGCSIGFDNNGAGLNITGGTLQTGNVGSGSASFTATGSVFNLRTNADSGTHTTSASGIRVLGNTLINPNTTLNGVVFSQIGPTFTNNGIFTVIGSASANVSLFNFGGSVPQTYNGIGTAGTSGQPLLAFDISNPSTVTIDPASPQIVTSRVNLFTGTFVNSSKITIDGATPTVFRIIQRGNASTQIEPPGAFDSAPTFNVGTTGLQLFYANAGTNIQTGFEIPTSRIVRRVLIDCPNGLTLNGGNLTVSNSSPVGSVELTNGIFSTATNTLIASASTTVTRTSGFVNGNLQMDFSAASSKVFHTGTANGYSPLTANVQAAGSTFPSSFTVKAIQGTQPNAPNPPSALKRYWQLTEGGNINAILTFQYLDPIDLPSGLESSLELKRFNGVAFDTVPMTLNTTANTATTTSAVSDFSDWTLISPISPTAAESSISGRVTTVSGRGIRNVVIQLNGGNLAEPKYARTNQFGYYRFTGLDAGQTYILNVSSKRYSFANPTRVITLNEDLTDEDFVSDNLK